MSQDSQDQMLSEEEEENEFFTSILNDQLKSITRDKSIKVVSFLRGRVNTADYVLALAANTIMVDYTTRLEMIVTRGVDCILREGSRKVALGHLDMMGSEMVDAGLADGVGNFILNINKAGVVIVPLY